MKYKTLGERITYARTLKGWKKNQLAREVKVSPAAVTQWEQGETKGLKPENLVAVARALGVLTDWLAAEVGPMTRETLSPEDQEMLDALHTLEPEKRSLVQMTIRALLPPTNTPAMPAYQLQDHHANQARRVLSPPPLIT